MRRSEGGSDPSEPALSGDGTAGLQRDVRKGLGWSLLNNGLARVGSFALTMVLARILEPHDYGVFAVGIAMLTVLLTVNDCGMTTGLIRWPGDVREVAPTALTLMILFSTGFFGLCFVLAPVVSEAMNAPDATGVVRLMAVGLVVDGAVSAVPMAIVVRGFRQRLRFVAEFTAFAVSSALTIALSLAGAGAWSLAWGRLAGNALTGALLWAFAGERYRPGWRREAAAYLLRFGVPLALSGLVAAAVMNVDYLIVGRQLGPEALGVYLLAFNLSSWPVNVLSTAVRAVAVPGFSRLRGDVVALRAGFVQSARYLAAVAVPVGALLLSLALPAIRVVYGEEWEGAAVPLRFLAVLGVARVFVELVVDFYVAQGRPRTVLAMNTVWLAVLVPALAIGAEASELRGVGVGHAVVALVVVGPMVAGVLRRSGVSLRALTRGLVLPFAGGLAAAVAALGAVYVLDGSLLELSVGAAVAVVAALGVLHPMVPDRLHPTRRWRHPGQPAVPALVDVVESELMITNITETNRGSAL